MKLFKRIALAVIIIVILAAVTGFFYLRHISTRALPDYNQQTTLQNLDNEVVIYRDKYGMPHIYAATEADLYRATGYAMAQDRLWQMDLYRRVTMGRLSEIFGKDLVQTDLLMRALRITEKSKGIMKEASPEILNALQAFTGGVNQYMETQGKKLPPEFFILGYEPEPWEPYHCLNLIGYMAWDLTMPWAMEFRLHQLGEKLGRDSLRYQQMVPQLENHVPTVFPGYAPQQSPPGSGTPPLASNNPGPFNRVRQHAASTIPSFHHSIIPASNSITAAFNPDRSLLSGTQPLLNLGLTIFHGSNNWAASGAKSANQKPILANDMHLSHSIPCLWYQVHQVVETKPGQTTLNVTGVAAPGQPFVIAGHNQHIAWGMTNVMVDDMDFYRERLNPQNQNQYRLNGEWKDLRIQKETIRTRGGEALEKVLKFTHRGPVISQFKDLEDEAVSMRWLGNEPSNELRSIYKLNRAQNWEQFREAMKTFVAVSQNVIYADIEGNIGLQTCAGVPLRKGNGYALIPGETDEYDWTGLLPFEELPYSYNPAEGTLSSANNRTVPKEYPHYISRWFSMPNRIRRIREMLGSKEELSIKDFKEIQTDLKSAHVEKHLGDIIRIIKKRRNLEDQEMLVLQKLITWDGAMTADSTAALIFETLYLNMIENLVKDELGDKLYRKYLGSRILVQNLLTTVWYHRDSPWCDNVLTKDKKETFEEWIEDSFKQTVNQLLEEYGDDLSDWRWGKVHTYTHNHPLGRITVVNWLLKFNRGPFPVPGSFHTVCPYGYSFRRPFAVGDGASQRHIYSTADWDQSLTVIPTGISGIPASPHYDDQSALYIDQQYRYDYFSKEKVTANARYKTVIKRSKVGG